MAGRGESVSTERELQCSTLLLYALLQGLPMTYGMATGDTAKVQRRRGQWESGQVGKMGLYESTDSGRAAPGNKTSYISALSPHTPVTAFERDPRRFKTLEKMLDVAHCKNVERVQGDFTQSRPMEDKWAGVTHM